MVNTTSPDLLRTLWEKAALLCSHFSILGGFIPRKIAQYLQKQDFAKIYLYSKVSQTLPPSIEILLLRHSDKESDSDNLWQDLNDLLNFGFR